MQTMYAWLAIYLEDGILTQKYASPALLDFSLTKMYLDAPALKLHPISALINNVLHAMLQTIGTQHLKHAYLVELILTMMHQLENANVALQDSALILQDLDVHVQESHHIMMLPTRNAFNATFHQFGMRLTTDA